MMSFVAIAVITVTKCHKKITDTSEEKTKI